MTIKPDGQPIIHKFPDRQDIELWPVMDLHIGDKYHATETWKAFCRRVLQRENTYIVLGGDLLTNATRNSVGNGVFENTLRPREQKRVVVEMLKPLKPRILCGTTGNHERRSAPVCAKKAGVHVGSRYHLRRGLLEGRFFLPFPFQECINRGRISKVPE